MSLLQQVANDYEIEEETHFSPNAGNRSCSERSLPQWFAIASCGAAIGTLIPVALYQSGAISHLPDPKGNRFDSDRLTTGPDSKPLGVPDSYMGLASYGTTMALLLSQRRTPLMNVVRHAKLGLDATMAGTKAAGQIRKGKYCSWCLGTAAATGTMLWFGYLAGRKRRKSEAT